MSMSEFDFSQLKKYAEKLERLDESQKEELMEDCTRQVAASLLGRAIRNTPVGVYESGSGKVGGTLRRGWTGGVTKNADAHVKSLPVKRIGHSYQMTIENGVEYAPYVEYGHRQTPGRYVPAIGKRLKNGWVEGKHMLKRAETDTEAKQQRIISLKVNKKLKEWFDDG